MGVLYNPQNVVVGLAVGYYAEAAADLTLPANSVEFGGDWGVDWQQAGGTEEGWRLGGESSTTSHNIEEQANPVIVVLDTRTLTISASLAEDTLDSMRLAFGGGTITTTAGVAPAPTIKEFKLSENVEEFAFGLDMQTIPSPIDGKRITRRIIIPRMSGSGAVDIAFRRAASKRLWPMTMTQLCKPSEVVIREIIPTA
jgi:hypothetical protein